jgi:hypothetical protein
VSVSVAGKTWSLNSKPGLLSKLVLFTALAIFYIYGVFWCIAKRSSVKDVSNVLKVFYYDFLRLRREHVIVEKVSEKERSWLM